MGADTDVGSGSTRTGEFREEASRPEGDRDLPLSERITRNPGPAATWAAVVAVLIAAEFGAIVSGLLSVPPWGWVGGLVPGVVEPVAALLATVAERGAELPTITSRSVIDNTGYQTPSGWEGTTLGLSPAVAWALRVAVIYTYSFTWLLVGWWGYTLYRRHYRIPDWTPRDDVVNRFRRHSWGLFGLTIVFAFVVMALFASVLGPTTVDQNIENPYENRIDYYNDETGQVESIFVGEANGDTQSRGQGDNNVGPLEYDQYDRFHPFGTLPDGKDLFTFMASGARVSLLVGLTSLGIAGGFAMVFAMLTAYYKGLVDLGVVIAGDSIQAMPQLLFIILASFVLSDTWIAEVYNGGLVLAILFGITGWPALWRAVRGPALQVSEREWIDAAKSYGQRPRVTMQKHMLPYVVGYFLIYASLSLGGVIIGIAGLSFLGLGIEAPVPEWGRAVSAGQPYVATQSWHISLIPGILVVIIVTGFNALGDGVRDAIDPESDIGDGGNENVAAGGGA
ncbi:ABC transporter permease [Halorubrum ezzemoulense]|uniref:ABC transporter permease n=1 Tax=Halorubrum ezzemoulense TaxID=337243 RepID=UPI00232E56A5|nr:ABC transporter permease [Halorubrum ezzemoulense]MDB9281479.1 ABC transporter permease [Halorubrum ezzemoulense]MDB9285023.1 ABC transporter permease [Halorubrum ezzemoulense]